MSPGAPGAAVALEERPVVAAADEAHVLALGSVRRLQARGARLRPRLHLGLLPEREPAPREDLSGHPGQHVGLVLGRIGAPGDQGDIPAAADAGVVPGRDPVRPDPVGELDQRREAERAVAAHAWVRRAPCLEALDELVDDRRPELAAQVESDMRHAERMARRAGRTHRTRRAAGPLTVGRARIDPQPQRDADGLEPSLDRLQQRDRRVDPAGHGDGDAARRGRQVGHCERGRKRPVQGVGGKGDTAAVRLGRREHRLEVGGADPSRVQEHRGPRRARRRARRLPSRAGRRTRGGVPPRCGHPQPRARCGSRRRSRCRPLRRRPRRGRPSRHGAVRERVRRRRRRSTRASDGLRPRRRSPRGRPRAAARRRR